MLIKLELDIASDNYNPLYPGDKLYTKDGKWAATILGVVRDNKGE